MLGKTPAGNKLPPNVHRAVLMRTITDLAADIRAGNLSLIDLLEQCLARIDAVEEKTRAWVVVDADCARRQANRLADELLHGHDRGPLHGIPVGVKDIIDVAELPTAAGSKRWANAIARQDARVVEQLRQAGAVIVGKTVTTAFAAFDPSVTNNPWNRGRTPGGSSSGSAAAVATDMVPAALGSQTGGSIIRPAAYCGVCGLKPTYNRVSLQGVVPLSPCLDHLGVIAGNVSDLAVMFQAIIQPDYEAQRLPTVTPVMPQEKKLVTLDGLFADRQDSAMVEAFESLKNDLRRKGWVIESRPVPASFNEVLKHHRTIMAVEAANYHEERFRRYSEDYPPKMTELIERGLGTTATEYAQAREHQSKIVYESSTWFDHRGMAILVPATSGPAPDRTTTGDPAHQAVWSYIGLPTITLPFAVTGDGLPLGLQLAGAGQTEAELFGTAMALEAEVDFRRPVLG